MTTPYVSSALLATKLMRMQMGAETAWNTPVAATNYWHMVTGGADFTPDVATTAPEEHRGTVTPAYTQFRTKTGGEWNVPGTLTYEDALFLGGMGIKGVVTPTGGPAYVWAYPAPIAQAWNALSMTMEIGQLGSTGTATRAGGCMCQEWTISGEMSKELTFTAKGFSGSYIPGFTLTASVPAADYTTEAILLPEASLFLSPAGSATGTTSGKMEYASYLQSGVLVKFQLTGTTGLTPLYTAGAYGPTAWTYGMYNVKLTLDMIYTSAVQSWLQTLLGSATNTAVGGSSATGNVAISCTSGSKIALFEFAGGIDANFKLPEDSQGAQMVSVPLTGVYDSGLANYFVMTLTNAIATLT